MSVSIPSPDARPGALRSLLGRIVNLQTLVAAILGALVLFVQQIEALATTPRVQQIFGWFYFARYEVLFLALLLMLWPVLSRSTGRLTEALIYFRTTPPRLRRWGWVAKLIALAVIVLAAVVSWDLYRLSYGKRFYRGRVGVELVHKAGAAYAVGDVSQARRQLAICRSISTAAMCERQSAVLEERLQTAVHLRTFYERLPLHAPTKTRVLRAIYFHDRDRPAYDSAYARYMRDLKALIEQYDDAVTRVRVDRAAGRAALAAIQAKFAGFGDAHILIREIDIGRAGGAPYLDALERLGPAEFTRAVTHRYEKHFNEADLVAVEETEMKELMDEEAIAE